MGILEDCAIVCVQPYLMPHADRNNILAVSDVIINYDSHFNSMVDDMWMLKPRVSDEKLDRVADITATLKVEIAHATDALGIINAYERAILLQEALLESVHQGKDTTYNVDKAERLFDWYKATQILPYTACTYMDINAIMRARDRNIASGAPFVMALVEKAKASL